METRRLLFTLASMACAQLGLSSAASAAAGLALMPSTVMLAGIGLAGECAAPLQPALGTANAGMASLHGASKAQAILGGRLSRLELIAQQQSSPAAGAMLAADITLAGPAMTPGAGGT